MSTRLQGVSLFSSCGIGETYLKDIGIDIILSNELIEKRAELHKKLYPDTKMICGDITKEEIFNSINKFICKKKIEFLIATPPCQGVSLAGKNKNHNHMLKDKRNFLIFKVIDFIHINKPSYILIENVPRFVNLLLPYKNSLLNIIDILKEELKEEYILDYKIMDSSKYGVPQSRKRLIVKIHKKDLKWNWPKTENQITLRQAIGHLPSLEAGENSNILWHNARNHTKEHILWMTHTPEGKSAFQNEIYFPKKKDGSKIKGFGATYSRMEWDKPAPTITMRNDAISSQTNVHPGRKLPNGKFSDARVLTPLELIILTSLPNDWKIPHNTPEILIRQCIGESVPPLLIKKVCEGIFK